MPSPGSAEKVITKACAGFWNKCASGAVSRSPICVAVMWVVMFGVSTAARSHGLSVRWPPPAMPGGVADAIVADAWGISDAVGGSAGILAPIGRARAGRGSGVASVTLVVAGVAAKASARLAYSTPRVALGRALSSVAHACIDVSDGLLADLAHVCRGSGVAAEVSVDGLPAAPALLAAFDGAARRALQAAGGDDYELCFTAAPELRDAVERAGREAATAVTRIGRIVDGEGVQALTADGQAWQTGRAGYQHFA